MPAPSFLRLNDDWNAEPNAPHERVSVAGPDVTLTFRLNHQAYRAEPGEIGRLTFAGCSCWRLGPANDEGWYRGQCRYSGVAPAWGHFYELQGPDDLAPAPTDWRITGHSATADRHFLFYLRDNTFEGVAAQWRFDRQAPAS